MPVARLDEQRDASQLRAILAKLTDTYNLYPLGNKGSRNPFDVYNPHPHEYQLGWADPEKLERKLSRGSEVVTPKVAQELYKIQPRECHTDQVRRHGLILIRTPRRAYEARIALGVLSAYDRLGAQIESFEAQKDAVILAEHGRRPQESRSRSGGGGNFGESLSPREKARHDRNNEKSSWRSRQSIDDLLEGGIAAVAPEVQPTLQPPPEAEEEVLEATESVHDNAQNEFDSGIPSVPVRELPSQEGK